jgi:hypothetical protein
MMKRNDNGTTTSGATYRTIIGQTAIDAEKDATTLTALQAERDAAVARAEAAEVAKLVEALQKIAHGTTPEADPDTGELIECWMGADEMQEIARAALDQIKGV